MRAPRSVSSWVQALFHSTKRKKKALEFSWRRGARVSLTRSPSRDQPHTSTRTDSKPLLLPVNTRGPTKHDSVKSTTPYIGRHSCFKGRDKRCNAPPKRHTPPHRREESLSPGTAGPGGTWGARGAGGGAPYCDLRYAAGRPATSTSSIPLTLSWRMTQRCAGRWAAGLLTVNLDRIIAGVNGERRAPAAGT